jgi:acyl carrier protein
MTRIIEILHSIRPEEDFDASGHFVEEGLLDSFDVITLVAELDRTFMISIEGVDILPENFKSVDTIVSLVRKYGVSV